MRAAIDDRRRRCAVFVWAAAAASIVSLPLPARPQTGLPGIGPSELTAETFSTFTSSVKMISRPEPGPPEAWFSAAAEHVGTVASATWTSVTLLEPMVDGLYDGLRIRVTGSSPAAGQILDIDTNHSSTRIDLRSAFSILPQVGDGVEIFTGSLPPGRWDAPCTQTEPCLDVQRARSMLVPSTWFWFDSGDVWDSDEEWCDAAHRPPGDCDNPENRFIVGDIDDPALENTILWAVSGTDLTGATWATFDCDARSHYPKAAGGLFENQHGSNSPIADDRPGGWLLVQGVQTRCWNRPAPGTATRAIEWGQGSYVYRQEFSGKILALHNRHGDLWDAARLVSMNGSSYTQGDRYVGGIVLVDVEAHTADYASMAGRCVATNDPFRSCNGTQFDGVGRGAGGEPIVPAFIDAYSGGDVLWVGGPAVLRNKDAGPDRGASRHFVEARGFHDYWTNSGVGGKQSVTLVNLQLEGGGSDATGAPALMFIPDPNTWGTTFEALVINSSFRGFSRAAAVVQFVPWITADRATDTALEMHWVNVTVTQFGKAFLKDLSSFDTPEIDGGARFTGRCLLIDAAHPSPSPSRVIEIRSSSEPLSTRCAKNVVDVQGWMDGDDAPGQIELCGVDSASYASEAMSGTMFQPGNAGDVRGWQIFSQGGSGDWGGEGVDLDVFSEPPQSPEVWDAVHATCTYEARYPLGQTLPIGFISTPENLVSYIRVAGVRDLGFNAPPGAHAVPGLDHLARRGLGLVLFAIGMVAIAVRRRSLA